MIFRKRLATHNRSSGAKYTAGQIFFLPVIVIHGFHHKRACLSFESKWKRLHKSRNNAKLHIIELMSGIELTYRLADTTESRILDLVYMSHYSTLMDTKCHR